MFFQSTFGPGNAKSSCGRHRLSSLKPLAVLICCKGLRVRVETPVVIVKDRSAPAAEGLALWMWECH